MEPLAVGGGEMNFPDWAPDELVSWVNTVEKKIAWAEESGGEYDWSELDRIVIKAITDPEMEKVWRSYKKRCYKREIVGEDGIPLNDSIWSSIQYQLVFGVNNVVNDPRPWSLLTPEQKRQELKKVHESIHAIGAAFAKGAFRANLILLPNLLYPEDIDKTIRTMPRHVEPKSFKELGEISASKLAHDAVPHTLLNCGTLYDILENLYVETQTALDDLDLPQVIERPNTRNVQTTRLIRNACIWHANKFGTPLYENVASIARVFLDESVTGRAVIDSFRPIKDQDGFEDTWRDSGPPAWDAGWDKSLKDDS